MLKCIRRELTALELDFIEQGRFVPTDRQEWRPIPMATDSLEEDVIDLNQTLTLEEAKWVLQLDSRSPRCLDHDQSPGHESRTPKRRTGRDNQ